MIKFFVILLFLLSSCVYPDIDTVPDFKDVKITEEELMDLCKLKNPYNRYIKNNYKRLKCFEKLNINTSRYGL